MVKSRANKLKVLFLLEQLYVWRLNNCCSHTQKHLHKIVPDYKNYIIYFIIVVFRAQAREFLIFMISIVGFVLIYDSALNQYKDHLV